MYQWKVVTKIKKPINFHVEQDVYDEIKKLAESKSVSMGWIVREALKRYMPKKKG